MDELALQSGCGLLLDLHNLSVNSSTASISTRTRARVPGGGVAPACPRRPALPQPRLRHLRIPRVVRPAARRSRAPRRARAHPPDAAGSNGGSAASLEEFQRAFADLIASPQACVEARRRPAEAFAGYSLTARKAERLRAIVMDDGMAANCTLCRVNRLVPVYGVMPLT